MCRPGWSGGLPLAADLHCDRNNQSGRGTPSHHPGQVARRASRDKATGKLHGSVARSRFHRSVAVAYAPLSWHPKIPCQVCSFRPDVNGKNFEIGLISKVLMGGEKPAHRVTEPKMERRLVEVSTCGRRTADQSGKAAGVSKWSTLELCSPSRGLLRTQAMRRTEQKR